MNKPQVTAACSIKTLKDKSGPFLFCALVVISILLFYTAYDKKEKAINFKDLADVLLVKDLDHTMDELNKVWALAGLGLLSIAMAIGPLAVFFSGIAGKFLWWRRSLGLTGVTFVLIHSFYGIIIHYRFSAIKMFFENDKLWGVIAALFSLAIFLAMAVTSNSTSIKALGIKRWKMLHRLGYPTLALGVLHFIIMETKTGGRITLRPYGWVFLCLPFITLFLKFIQLTIKRRV
jgi:DMSO/TMAO reductase YedYZ heme-binding membrane subunit